MNTRVRRNVARTAGLALVAVSLLLIGLTGPAGADDQAATLKAQGWWSQLPSAVAAPGTTKGQLVVQGNPKDKNGTAYSAVRYAIGANTSVTNLTLKVGANGDQGGSSAVVLACQTGSAWSPVDGGDMSTAPKVTDKCVTGKRSDDGASWTFAIGTLQISDFVDVAIVPGMDTTTKAPSTFSLTFDQPSNGSVATTPGGSSPSASTPYTGGTLASGGSPSGAVAPRPSAVTPHAPSVPTASPAIPTGKVGETATSPAKQAASQPALNSALNTQSASSSKPNKTAGYIVLAFAALVGLYAYRQDNLLARNGGVLPGATEEVGGLGRFTKPRTGQPPALT